MMDHAEFSNPRLVALYDTLNPFSAADAFYLEAAERFQASTIIDIGCGTGLLTCALATRDRQVIGVEPERAMLDVARHRPGGQRVQWIEGDATRLGFLDADLGIMTGHVAQVFLGDKDWKQTLSSLHGALRPGGHVMFESRNPAVRRWMSWTPERSRQEVTHEEFGRITVWTRVLEAQGNRVPFEMHYLFESSGEELVSTNMIIFRSQEEITLSLVSAGFSVREVYGNWDGRPPDATSPELIFVAARN